MRRGASLSRQGLPALPPGVGFAIAEFHGFLEAERFESAIGLPASRIWGTGSAGRARARPYVLPAKFEGSAPAPHRPGG